MNVFRSLVHEFPPNPAMLARQRRRHLPVNSENKKHVIKRQKLCSPSSTAITPRNTLLDDSTTWQAANVVTIERDNSIVLSDNYILHDVLLNGQARSDWTTHDYETLNLIGQGTFGAVFKMQERVSGTNVALKIICKESMLKDYDYRMELLHREIQIQKSLDHDHIVRLHGHWEDEKNFYLTLEFAPFGDLEYFRHKQPISRSQQVSFVLQITVALEHLASRGIAHRDIKGENCLVFANEKIKLADFGWAVLLPGGNYQRATLCGTPEFVPPEMIIGEGVYDARFVDRWSLGVLTWELLEVRGLFELSSDMKRQIMEQHGFSKPRLATFETIRAFVDLNVTEAVDSEFADFCSKLIVRNPGLRMSFSEALCHPLFHGLKCVVVE